MELKGKYEFLHKIFDNEEQINKIKSTVYDVTNISDILCTVVDSDNGFVNNILWRCGLRAMIGDLAMCLREPSLNASHDALNEKMERQKQDLLSLLDIMEKMDLDFIFINDN